MIGRKVNETERNRITNGPKAPAVATSPHPARKRCMRPRQHQLAHDIRAICRRNPQGTHRAQVERLRTLLLCAKQLDRRKKAINLTADDIHLLVNQWHADHLVASTIRFRLVCLHWLARKVGNPGIVESDRVYGVDRRLR